jgi:hypothetical protein
LAAKQDHVALFTIGLGADADSAYLQALAQNTGGRYYAETYASDLDKTYNLITTTLRTQYALAWQSKTEADGASHQLEVKVAKGGKEIGNTIPFIARKPLNPGIRFKVSRPTGLLGLAPEKEIAVLNAGDIVRTNWAIVPDLSARYDIQRVEYYLNNEPQAVRVVEVAPFSLPWTATGRAVKEETPFTLRAVAYDVQNHRGEAALAVKVAPAPPDLLWLVLGVGLILIVAITVLLFALRQQRQQAYPQPVAIGSTVGPTAGPTPGGGASGYPGGPPTPARPPDVIVPAPGLAEAGFRSGPTAWLLVTAGPDKGHEFQLGRPELRLGRSSDNDICLQDPTVSRNHVTLRQEGGQWQLYDLGALNPAKVNGRQVSRCRLEDGDEILVGNTTLVFKLAR